MKVCIAVATHVPFWVPSDSVYFPIHVGAEGHRSIGYVQDDLGDNISAKNATFGELTALYWIWKHNTTDDALGLCRFRRYFGKAMPGSQASASAILTRQDFETLFETVDAIVPKKRMVGDAPLGEAYCELHHTHDLDVLAQYIREEEPAYAPAWDWVLTQQDIYSHNMFVLKRPLFDAYCDFLFRTLFALEKRIDASQYPERERRVCSFFGEILFNVWLRTQQPHLHEATMLYLVPQSWSGRVWEQCKKIFRRKR